MRKWKLWSANINLHLLKSKLYLFKNIELTSSWEIGGFLDDAAIRRGRKKHVTRVDNWRLYSSSHSTILKTILFRFLILSAWGERMYNSTICFHRLLHNQPRKKLWTWKEKVLLIILVYFILFNIDISIWVKMNLCRYFNVSLYMYCRWRSNYKDGRVEISLTSLTLSHFCACPNPRPTFLTWSTSLKIEVIVHFVDIFEMFIKFSFQN